MFLRAARYTILKRQRCPTLQLLGQSPNLTSTFVLLFLLNTDAARTNLLLDSINETRDRGIRDSDIPTNGQLNFDFDLYLLSILHLNPTKQLRLHANLHVVEYCQPLASPHRRPSEHV